MFDELEEKCFFAECEGEDKLRNLKTKRMFANVLSKVFSVNFVMRMDFCS